MLRSSKLKLFSISTFLLLALLMVGLLSNVESTTNAYDEVETEVSNTNKSNRQQEESKMSGSSSSSFFEDAKREAAAAQPLYKDIPGLGEEEEGQFSEEVLVARFEDWANEQNRQYTSDNEKLHRFAIWIQNDVEIQKHNHKVPPPSFTMGHNQFSDMTKEEFNSMHTFGGGGRGRGRGRS